MAVSCARSIVLALLFLGQVVLSGGAEPASGYAAGEKAYRQALQLIKENRAQLALPLLWRAASTYHEAALWISLGYCYFLLEETEKSFGWKPLAFFQ